MITSLDQLDFSKKYTYSDYILWKFKERVELLKGFIFPMAAPNTDHQHVSFKLTIRIGNYIEKIDCRLFTAPFDVRLPLPAHRITEDNIDTIVQPDLCVICDKSKIKKQGCVGAPDLIVEILSPGNSKREMRDKFDLYEEAGVLEYWIVDPIRRTVLVYYLKDEKYAAVAPPYTDEGIVTSIIFPDLKVNLIEVFPEEDM